MTVWRSLSEFGLDEDKDRLEIGIDGAFHFY
jgi:hypothetical protein